MVILAVVTHIVRLSELPERGIKFQNTSGEKTPPAPHSDAHDSAGKISPSVNYTLFPPGMMSLNYNNTK